MPEALVIGAAAVEKVELPAGACCRQCGYLLGGVTAAVCPECGRGFDSGDAETFAPSVRQWRLRRWKRRGVVGILVAGGAAVLLPRGYAESSITMTCPMCGLAQTTTCVRPLGPRWVPWVWPSWTSTRGAAAEGADCPHGVSFQMIAQSRVWTFRGPRGDGMLTASGTASPTTEVTVNAVAVHEHSAKRVLRDITRAMAWGGEYGVTMNEVVR